ncbi:response regulator, partial [Desulfobacter sp. UBA2225]|uniref:response regulator n=1 Tax=Desulfobacter sp. UBA2225 TaxID=1961413 RepID=UPI00257EFCC4
MINFSHSTVPVVLVDDERSELDAYGFLLTSMGVNQVVQVRDSRRLPAVMADLGVCVLFLDLNMPHKSGFEVLKELRITHPHIPVVIITANSEIESAVECLKQGAHDYLVKPINMNTFASALRNALEICALRNEVFTLKGVSFNRNLKSPEHFQRIITQNPTMIGLFQYIESISSSREPILIQVPPLRERKEDIPLIAAYLRDQAAKAMGKPVVETGQQFAAVLAAHPFPGNIRELKTYIYDAVAQSTDTSLRVETILDRLADVSTLSQPQTPNV